MELTNMWLFKWLVLAACIFVGISKIALGVPLDSWSTWAAAQPNTARQIPPGALIVRGTGTNSYYVLEADPTTGAIPVSGSFSLSYDTNYGTVGASTLRSAAQVGNATGAALFGAGTTTAQVLRVVLPTDQSAIPASQSGTWTMQPGNTANTTAWLVKEGGHAYADSVRNVYSSTNVTTGAWVQLIASTAAVINCITLFDSCGQTLELGTGAAASETRKLIIPPGGLSGCTPLAIPAATRVSIRAISATCSVGELDITALQ